MSAAPTSLRRCAECGQPKKLNRNTLCFGCGLDKQLRAEYVRGYNVGFGEGFSEGYTRAEREWVELRNAGGVG